MFYHEKLHCYQRSILLCQELCHEIRRWPKGYGYLSDQLKRALSSVVLNLAEGNNRRSTKERRRFFEISRASACESAACLDLALVFGILSKEEQSKYHQECLEITKMISKLR